MGLPQARQKWFKILQKRHPTAVIGLDLPPDDVFDEFRQIDPLYPGYDIDPRYKHEKNVIKINNIKNEMMDQNNDVVNNNDTITTSLMSWVDQLDHYKILQDKEYKKCIFLTKNEKNELNSIFSQYGTILQITAHSNLRMKGQAFITFELPENAANALNSLNKTIIFDKPVHIEYSKSNLDLVYAKSYTQPENGPLEAPEIRERKEAKKERERKIIASKATETNKRPHQTTTDAKSPISFDTPVMKKPKLQDWKALPPNSILLLQNIPETQSQDQLKTYFENTNGFINLRYVKVRKLAFIEFDSESTATDGLLQFEKQISNDLGEGSFITYAKK